MVNITEYTKSSSQNTKVRIKMQETNTTKETKLLFRDYIIIFYKKTREKLINSIIIELRNLRNIP